MNFYCPNSLVGQDHYWAALEEIGKRGATEFWLWPMRTTRSLGAEGVPVNDHFWCSALLWKGDLAIVLWPYYLGATFSSLRHSHGLCRRKFPFSNAT